MTILVFGDSSTQLGATPASSREITAEAKMAAPRGPPGTVVRAAVRSTGGKRDVAAAGNTSADRLRARSVASSAGTQTLQRAALLLKQITVHHREGIRLVDLYRKAGLERPTAHRILQGLSAERLVRQDPETRRYHLGPLIYEMGLAATPPLALRDICQPYLRELAALTGDMIYMTVRSGLDGVCVARAQGAQALPALVHDVGRHRPLNVGSSGIALLAALPDEEVSRIWRANTVRTLQKNPRYSETELLSEITGARRRGYTLLKVLESPVARSIGMAVRFPDCTPAAGISLAAPATRLDDVRILEVVPLITQTVRAIEGELLRYTPATQAAGY